jgi:hypothetical protein
MDQLEVLNLSAELTWDFSLELVMRGHDRECCAKRYRQRLGLLMTPSKFSGAATLTNVN